MLDLGPNTFGETVPGAAPVPGYMASETVVAETDAPTDARVEHLEVGSLGPPEPLTRTLERLAELSDDAVLVQHNDRAPRHLYPRLESRGYAFETVETTDETVTVIWKG